MEYIVDHETIKSWTIYKSIIYLKHGLYISPCFKTNVDQYIKPLISFKKAQCSPKTGYDAAQMLSCVAIVEQK